MLSMSSGLTSLGMTNIFINVHFALRKAHAAESAAEAGLVRNRVLTSACLTMRVSECAELSPGGRLAPCHSPDIEEELPLLGLLSTLQCTQEAVSICMAVIACKRLRHDNPDGGLNARLHFSGRKAVFWWRSLTSPA